jgi:hypothetical protein
VQCKGAIAYLAETEMTSTIAWQRECWSTLCSAMMLLTRTGKPARAGLKTRAQGTKPPKGGSCDMVGGKISRL